MTENFCGVQRSAPYPKPYYADTCRILVDDIEEARVKDDMQAAKNLGSIRVRCYRVDAVRGNGTAFYPPPLLKALASWLKKHTRVAQFRIELRTCQGNMRSRPCFSPPWSYTNVDLTEDD